MGGGKKRKLRSEDGARQLVELAEKCLSELHHIIPFVPPASGSVETEGNTFLHESEDEPEAERRPKEIVTLTLRGLYLQGLVEELLQTDTFRAPQKIQLDSHSSSSTPGLQKGLVDVDSSVPPSSSTQPPPTPCFPPRPAGGKPEEVLNWRIECIKVRKAHDKAHKKVLSSESGNNLPTLEALQYNGSINAVQDWRSKQAVLAAARSIVSITPILDDGPIGSQCTGFILRRYEHAGVIFSVIVTCSAVVCNAGRKLDPLPKLSVSLPDQKTVIEAHLLYFNDHFDIAFLLLPMELSLNIPRLGCCPDYNQEVFVLGRDRKAFLRVTHGVISWTEESDFMGRDHYMFLDGEVAEGGIGMGGPVIDHEGVFRGMAFNLHPEPAVLSISTIMTCFTMFMQFGRIPRPMLGLSLRTVASVDVGHLEVLAAHNIKSGYIVEVVHTDSPARGYGIGKGDIILSLDGHRMLSLPKLEDYLLSLGWKNLLNSVSTIDMELVVCDRKGQRRSITVPCLVL